MEVLDGLLNSGASGNVAGFVAHGFQQLLFGLHGAPVDGNLDGAIVVKVSHTVVAFTGFSPLHLNVWQMTAKAFGVDALVEAVGVCAVQTLSSDGVTGTPENGGDREQAHGDVEAAHD